jgi:putative addiction module CopG family antidote
MPPFIKGWFCALAFTIETSRNMRQFRVYVISMVILRTSLNVSLTPALEPLISERVSSGRYQTASESVRAGFRRLEQTEAAHVPATAKAPHPGSGMERA